MLRPPHHDVHETVPLVVRLARESELAVELPAVERLETREAQHGAPVDRPLVVADARVRVLRLGGEGRGAPRLARHLAQALLVGRLGHGERPAGRGHLGQGGVGGLGRFRLHLALEPPERVADEHGAAEGGVGTLAVARQFAHGEVEDG